MKYIEYIKSLFAKPSAESIALNDLEETRRQLLEAQSTQEYAAKMVEYHSGKIKRLTGFLKASMKEEASKE